MDEEQIRGLASLGPLAIVRGVLTVSDQPGPGHRYDWAKLDATALTKAEVTERLTPPANLVRWN